MKQILNHFPGPDILMSKHKAGTTVPEVNGHLHSPHSFCAFDSIAEIFSMARAEKLTVLGINDFFTTDGFPEFERHAGQNRIFPLFNIEFMGLMKEFQDQDIRVNDPNNPGRIYFSGKALEHPVNLPDPDREFLLKLREYNQEQAREMCARTGMLLREIQAPFSLDYESVKNKYALNLVRERHIARALREAAFSRYDTVGDRMAFFQRLFDGKSLISSLNKPAEVENEIRSVILKKGGRAFVPEESHVFPELGRIITFILNAGGVPCYPVLLDNCKGEITRFEEDWEQMDSFLDSHGVGCLELIPMRNSASKLEEFVDFFLKRKYVILFGTEHNTPERFPLQVKVEKDRDLSPGLKLVSYQGASVLAAHQYLHARGMGGFVRKDGTADRANLEYFQKLGHAVIMEYTSSNNQL